MKRIISTLLLASFALADPVTDAADAVLRAFDAKDQSRLKQWAAKDKPDPWMVADELCARGKHDAAEAFAKAAPRKDVEKLPAYIVFRRGKAPNVAARRALAAASAALRKKDPKGALAALRSAASGLDVASVRVRHARGLALRSLRHLKESHEAYRSAGNLAERLGWLARAASALDEAGLSAAYRSDWRGAATAWEQRLQLEESRGNRSGVAATLVNIGITHRNLGNDAKALDCYGRSLKVFEELEDRASVARTLNNIGVVHESRGNYAKALDDYGRALRLFEKLAHRAGVASCHANIGNIHYRLSDYTKALDDYERALKLFEKLGNRGGEASCVHNIGNIHQRLGNYSKALEHFGRSLKLSQKLRDRAGVASSLGSIGIIHELLGNYAKALDYQQRSLKLKELVNRVGIAGSLANIGIIHYQLGDYAKALDYYGRALKLFEERRDRAGVASSLKAIGNIHEGLEDYPKALDYQQRALKLFEKLGDHGGVAGALGNIGVIHENLRDYAKALDYQQRSLKLKEKLRDRVGVAGTLNNIGNIHDSLGDYPKALGCYERSVKLSEELGALDFAVSGITNTADLHLRHGQPAEAALAARRGVEKLPLLIGRLAEEQGAKARARWSRLFETGVAAGRELKDPAVVCYFLESGRAGTLLESLGGRAALRDVAIPEESRKAETATRAAILAARARHGRALSQRDQEKTRAARTEIEKARGKLVEAVAKIQRNAKAAANLVYPKADPLEKIRARLTANEAMILYALMPNETLALVVRRDGARTVSLEKTATIEKACAALVPWDGASTRGLSLVEAPSRASDPAAQVGKLRDLVLAPLQLDASVTRLLISPHGALASVPFALLARDKEIAYVASGTTYGVLLDERKKRGREVLALGDPDYGVKAGAHALAVHTLGKPLTRLPGSRAEAKAVGDTVLLDKDASIAGLGKALASDKRWRSVHFACHGLVRADQPMLSSLALTPDESGGFLTVLDVFRMKIPADLVVLSACETGRGKVYSAEGVMGFTRAFMFAGAPRVIVSLWKVDDDATKALMVKFYELWKTEPTATALRKAQEHVASKKQWKHPYYWAAWQLWGLPD